MITIKAGSYVLRVSKAKDSQLFVDLGLGTSSEGSGIFVDRAPAVHLAREILKWANADADSSEQFYEGSL